MGRGINWGWLGFRVMAWPRFSSVEIVCVCVYIYIFVLFHYRCRNKIVGQIRNFKNKNYKLECRKRINGYE